MFKNKKGFTLVELMVVVAILGVLVAVAVPAYNGITDSSKEKVCAANIRTIESAIVQALAKGETLYVGYHYLSTEDDVLNKYITDGQHLLCPFTGTKYTLSPYAYRINNNGTFVVECPINHDNPFAGADEPQDDI